MKIIRLISEILGRVLTVLIVSLLVQMLMLMFLQVIGRHLLLRGLFWAEELSRYSMVTIVYLGAAVACKNRDHIAVTFFEGKLKGKLQKIYRLIIALLSAGFLAAVIKFGFEALPLIAMQTSANMRMPMHYIYVMIPLGSCIMLFYIFVEILELILELAGKKHEGGKGNKA